MYIEFKPWTFKHFLNGKNLFETYLSKNEQKVYNFSFGL